MKINSTSRLTLFGLSIALLGYAADSSAITWVDATDSQLQQGMPIKAAHVKEIRDKMTWDRSGANAVFDTGNVGIGTSSISQRLTIAGGNIDLNDGELYVRDTSGNTFGVGYAVEGGSQLTVFSDHRIQFTESDNDNIRVHMDMNSGNVGIGTTSPSARLDIVGSAEINGDLDFVRGNTSDIRSIGRISFDWTSGTYDNADYHGIESQNEAGNFADALRINSYADIINTIDSNANSSSRFKVQRESATNGQDLMTIDESGHTYIRGNLGVGASSPGAKLDVNGTAMVNYLRVNQQNGSGEGGEIRLDGSGSNTTWYLDNVPGRVRFHHDGSERFTIRNNGRVGIGTSSPGAPLHVAGNIIANNPTANNHVATKSYVDAQVISGGDNLGNHIGTQDLVFNNYGIGIVGSYSSYRYQNLFSMGTAYTPADNGTSLGNMYGIAYTHSNVGGESIPGLGHQALFVSAGDTRSAVGHGIWTKYDITGNRFMDQNSSSYYLDPNSVSYLNDVRANIMYDRNNTGYYVNPASTTNLNNLYVQGNELGVNGELYACGSAGCNHFAYNNGGGTNYIRGNTYFNGIFYDENNTGYYVNPASTSIYNDLRANIFYDNNNTSYYLNPNSVSYLNDIRPNIIYDRNNTGYYWNGNGTTSENDTVIRTLRFHGVGGNSSATAQAYGIYQESGGWSHPYPDLMIRYHTGIKMSAHSSYGGIRFYTRGGEGLSVTMNDHLTAVGIIRSNQGFQVDGRTVIDDGGGWHRSYGNSGWYNGSYGGGWYMQDSTWIRTYGNKSIYHNTGTMRTDGTFEVGPSGNRFRVLTNGRVGVGKSSPGERLDINGSAKADAFLYNSDARLKTNVKTVAGLDIIKQLRGVTFDWKNNGKASVGLIAQEVEPIVPEAVKTSDTDGYKTVDYAKLVAPLIEAVKEQQSQIEAQEDRMEAQQAEIEALKALIRE